MEDDDFGSQDGNDEEVYGEEDEDGHEEGYGEEDYDGQEDDLDDLDDLAILLGGIDDGPGHPKMIRLADPRLKRLGRADHPYAVTNEYAATRMRFEELIWRRERRLRCARESGDAAAAALYQERLSRAEARFVRFQHKVHARELQWNLDVANAKKKIFGESAIVLMECPEVLRLAKIDRRIGAWATPFAGRRDPAHEDLVLEAHHLAVDRFALILRKVVFTRLNLGFARRAFRALGEASSTDGSSGADGASEGEGVGEPVSSLTRADAEVTNLEERLHRYIRRADRQEERLVYVTKPTHIFFHSTPPTLGVRNPAPLVRSFLERCDLGIPRINLWWREAELNEHLVTQHYEANLHDIVQPLVSLDGPAARPADGNIRPRVRETLARLWAADYGAHEENESWWRRALKDAEEEQLGEAMAGTPSALPPATPAARQAVRSIIRLVTEGGLLARPRPPPAGAARLLRDAEDTVMAEAAAASKAARRRRRRSRPRPLDGDGRDGESVLSGTKRAAPASPAAPDLRASKKPKSEQPAPGHKRLLPTTWRPGGDTSDKKKR